MNEKQLSTRANSVKLVRPNPTGPGRPLSPMEVVVASRWFGRVTMRDLYSMRVRAQGKAFYIVDGDYSAASTSGLRARLAELRNPNCASARSLRAELARRQLGKIGIRPSGPDAA